MPEQDIEKAEPRENGEEADKRASPDVKETEAAEEPPIYKSEVKDEEKAPRSRVSYMRKLIGKLFSSVISLVFMAILSAIPITSIVIGSVYVKDCPRERYIPIYLIVSGCFGLIPLLSRLGIQIRNRKDGEGSSKPNPLECIISLFLFCWFITGNVWVYGTLRSFTTDDPEAPSYCHPVVFWYAFSEITLIYVFLGLGCLCCCGCLVFAAIKF